MAYATGCLLTVAGLAAGNGRVEIDHRQQFAHAGVGVGGTPAERVPAQRLPIRPAPLAPDDRHVELAGIEPAADVLRHPEADLDHGLRRQAGPDDPHEVFQPHAGRMVAGPEREPYRGRVREAGGIVMRGEQRSRLGKEHGALGGQPDEPRRPLQQLAADRSLQRAEPLADHGLHGARRLRRAGEVAEVDDKDEEPDGLEI